MRPTRIARIARAVALLFGVITVPVSGLGTELVVDGLRNPVFLAAAPGDPERLFVIEQPGVIRIVRTTASEARLAERPFLDIQDRVRFGGERGLLGMAFHPGYPRTGWVFVNYSSEPSGATVISRFSIDPDDQDRVDPTSEVVLLEIDQPFANHNGGMIAFGPDGYLYVGTGDGGSRNDPLGAGQRLDTLLGKLLRLDVGFVPARPAADNPFKSQVDAHGEIWAYGLRNPWRFSFDRETGDLFIGDVGQNMLEEIDRQPASSAGGENYGWSIAEGQSCLGGGGRCGTEDRFVAPIHQYDRRQGVSVTGGYVYRGEAIPELRGAYLFADFGSARIWALEPRGDHWGAGRLRLREITAELEPPGPRTIRRISSFGEDAAGELYLLDHLDGEVFRIVR